VADRWLTQGFAVSHGTIVSAAMPHTAPTAATARMPSVYGWAAPGSSVMITADTAPVR